MFNSTVQRLGYVWFPEFGNISVLMMPFKLEDARSIPSFLRYWERAIYAMIARRPVCKEGTAYLTIDEARVHAGECRRRPGLHVDGWSCEGNSGAWGGGGGAWGGSKGGHGMLMAANAFGCYAWHKSYEGEPRDYGDCEHLRDQFPTREAIRLLPHAVYHLSGLTVHESVPLIEDCNSQFIRISMPSKAGWYASCTPNPLGIQPEGPILPPRPQHFTDYRKRFSPGVGLGGR